MFEDSLLDYGGRGKTKKPVTVLVSFVLQSMLVTVAVLVPLIYAEALPKRDLMSFLVAPPPPPPPPPPPKEAPKIRVIPRVQAPQQMVQPRAIPKQVAIIEEEPLPPSGPVGGVVGGVAGGLGSGAAGGVLGGIISAAPPPPPPPPPAAPIRVGGQVQAAKMVRQVPPPYPPLARQARIQGTVRLEAIIDKDGNVKSLSVVSGHPLLVQAAIDSVSQWKYQPTLLNGTPVEVATTVDVNFVMR